MEVIMKLNLGNPIGSFTLPVEQLPLNLLGHEILHETALHLNHHDELEPIIVDIKGSVPHALFMDCTHDNETPHQKRTAADSLPNSAIVAMTLCAVGSVMGYDELVPSLLNVVSDSRKYRLPRNGSGISPAKSIFLPLHRKMVDEGYSEIHVHQENDFIQIHRMSPITHKGYLLIARCAFRPSQGEPSNFYSQFMYVDLTPIRLQNQKVQVFQSATLSVSSGCEEGIPCIPYQHGLPEEEPEKRSRRSSWKYEDENPISPTQLYHAFTYQETHVCAKEGCINGLPCSLENSNSFSRITDLAVINTNGAVESVITANSKFVPGSIVIYETWVDEHEKPVETSSNSVTIPILPLESISLTPTSNLIFDRLRESLGINEHSLAIRIMLHFGYNMMNADLIYHSYSSTNWPPGLLEAISCLDHNELNMLLYRSSSEEYETFGILTTTSNPKGIMHMIFLDMDHYHIVEYKDSFL